MFFLILVAIYAAYWITSRAMFNLMKRTKFSSSLTKNQRKAVRVFALRPAAMAITIGLLWAFPLKAPVATISNGDKTVVFYGMQHLAKDSFYQKVTEEIDAHRKDGKHIMYEGVGLEAHLSSYVTDNCIIESTNLFGFAKQPYCLGNIQYGDTIADMSKEEFEQARLNKIMSYGHSAEDANQILDETNGVVSEKMGTFYNSPSLGILIKPVLASSSIEMLLSDNGLPSTDRKDRGGKDIKKTEADSAERFIAAMSILSNDIIHDQRNNIVVEAIKSSDNNEIAITYGMAHMEGILDLLKKEDPSWEVTELRYITAM